MRNLSTIATFIEVARQRSFAEAAKTLGLSTSATSKSVARLEDELGVKLLHRTTRSVGLTPEGDRFLEGASAITGAIDDLVDEVTDRSEVLRGKLTVGTTMVFGRQWLTKLIVEFQKLHPELSIELQLDDRTTDLAAGGCDLVIRAGDLGDHANLVARHYFNDQAVTCASPDYLARKGTPTVIEELVDHDCLSFRNPSTGRVHPYRFTLEGHSVSRLVDSPLVINEGEALATAARAGAGIVQLPSYIVEQSVCTGSLVPILKSYWPDVYPYHLLYLDRRLVSRRIRALIDFLVAHKPQTTLCDQKYRG